DKDHTFVCCLSSLNLARWDEWKDTDTVQLSVWFLDGIMEEFIQKASGLRGFERALRFAVKSRALGLGVLGLHSYFQKNMIAFDSLQAYLQNKIIFKKIREEAELATTVLATEYG
ncbi:MAG: ribonucleotide-diphosphate reductase subunit alpha, partial [bacterium]